MTGEQTYDVIVIGGGHAGAEAAWAAANLLRGAFDDSGGRQGGVPGQGGIRGRVAMITMDVHKIGAMSCNPAIGGLAKGQMVREIDAMGGMMGLAADATGIQFRMLNRSKGPAVWGPRCQSDKYQYAAEVQRLLATRANLDVLAGVVESFIVENGVCRGVVYTDQHGSATIELRAGATILTTGTFMRGLMHTGESQTPGGRIGEQPAEGISGELRRLGFELGRLKTGTPPRLAAESIDFNALELQPGDDTPHPFSDLTDPAAFPVLEQRPCWITHTNETAHAAIRANLDRAPMYNGQIETAGPRYCPSIEDKVVRFADRPSHHVYLEPESLASNEIYCNGISTSLPQDVQDVVVGAMPGCERAKILRYGYAVEYDMVRPHQIDATCMTKPIAGLFLAGQINGTSGYEEAAGQGLIAGLNAVRFARGDELIRLGRADAYIGVMLDDLVTKPPREPYRMFTSRAEHRLLLRSDNAAQRLTPRARAWGLIDDERWHMFEARKSASEQLQRYIETHHVAARPMADWVCAANVDTDALLAHLNGDPLPAAARDRRVVAHLLAEYKYAGYIGRQQKQIDRMSCDEKVRLPADLSYEAITGLRTEARQTLEKFRPATLGQAARLPGVTPADVMVVHVAVRR